MLGIEWSGMGRILSKRTTKKRVGKTVKRIKKFEGKEEERGSKTTRKR